MGKISIEDRTKQSKGIVAYFLNRIKVGQLSSEQQIKLIYNDAIRDVIEAMDTYIKKNPQHAVIFRALQDEFQWMPLVGVGDE